MKKSMLVLTAALMFGNVATAQTAATASAPQVPALTDVPAGHWAKDAIDRLVGRGILLGYPDGTFRGTQNLTRYEAAVIIARLLEQMSAGNGPALGGEDLVALQNAVQELAADLAALGVRVSDLEENAVSKEDFSRLEARVEELAAGTGDDTAVADLQAQIADLTARAEEYDTLRADVDDNASQIAALNDLTVLLNQDILDLQDRVSAVEAAQADFVTRADFDNLSTKVTGIDTRVGVLEKAPKFSVVGSIDAAYGRLALVKGRDFDVSRLINGTFAAGVFDSADAGNVEEVDTGAYTGTGVRFGVRASQLTTANGLIVVNNAAINFRTQNTFNIVAGDPLVFVNDANADGTINGQKFTVKYHRTAADFKFQNYLFNNMDESGRRGIVATVEATTLPGAPKLTIVAGNTNDKEMVSVAVATDADPTKRGANYWGVNSTWKVGDGGKFGVSYAQVERTRTAFGVDADLKFGPIGVKGEGVVSAPTNPTFIVTPGTSFQKSFQDADKAGYLEARADLGIVKFGANARAIDPEFGGDGTEANAAMSSTYEFPYKADQVGFGAALGTNLGPVALGAYADRYTNWVGGNPALGFGVKAGAKFGALEAVAFFNNLTVNGDTVDGKAPVIDNGWMGSDYNKNANAVGMGIANVPFAMTSTFGAQISHDGNASNALVKNLNFTVGDAFYRVSKTNSVYAYGDYTASLGGITIKPLLRFHMASNNSGDAANNIDTYNFTTFKYGVKLSSGVLTSVPFQPSLYANVVGRNSTGKVSSVATNELLAQGGIGFNRFLLDGMTANVGYSYYQGKNISMPVADNTPKYVGEVDKAFNAADDRIYANAGTRNVKLNGLFTQVGWSGLTANYGLFKHYEYDGNGGLTNESIAQGFKVAYNFKF